MSITEYVTRAPARIDLPRYQTDHPTLTPRPSFRAFRILQVGFTLIPILAGADKFLHWLTDWDRYLASPVSTLLPMAVNNFTVDQRIFMLLVGGFEITAGLLVALVPRLGAFTLAVWFLGVGTNLLLLRGYTDLAIRDFGLALSALGLGLLAMEYGRPIWRSFRSA